MTKNSTENTEWPLWEVFYQPKDGKPFEHAGSVHAPDAEMALQNARDTYARRNEGIAFWVVPSDQIVASSPEDQGPFFDPANDKPYRHPQFYSVPRAVKKRK
jgi:ring-1,2-phenylacetyl-CoA epoxidase subunit PaaB